MNRLRGAVDDQVELFQDDRADQRGLAAAILLTAPGIAMIFQGQEMLETRPFGFKVPTPVDFARAADPKFSGIVNLYRDLIALRRNLRSHHMVHTGVLQRQWKTYAEGAATVGRRATCAEWAVARNVFVADTTHEARRLARSNSLGRCIQYILDLTAATAPQGVAMWKRDAGQADADCTLDYFMDEVIIAGDPEHVTHRLLALREEIGAFGTLILTAHDWDDRARWLRSLELFAREVAPVLRKSLLAGK